MEVDLNAPLTPVVSRHSSPFCVVMPGSAVSSASTCSPSAALGQAADRKRRRSLQSISRPLSPSYDFDSQGARGTEHDDSDGDEAPAVSSDETSMSMRR